MSLARRLEEWRGVPLPARDLPFIDAGAVLVALFLAYATRAALSSNFPFAWDSVAPFVRVALPVAVCALLLSAAAMALYGSRAADAGLREHAAAIAYAVAVTAAVGVFWGGALPPTAPLIFTAAVYLLACVHLGRRCYWRMAGS